MNKETDDAGTLQIVEESKDFWRKLGRSIVRGSLSAIENAAKQVVGVNGILIAFYSSAIAISKLRNHPPDLWQLLLLLSPIVFWLLSLMAALSVFWTSAYSINLESSLGGKDTIEKIIRRKHTQLKIAFLSLVVGVILLLQALSVYLLF